MDLERLRQAALLLEQENARLFRRLESLVGREGLEPSTLGLKEQSKRKK